MSIGYIRIEVWIDKGGDCGSGKEYGEKMKDGGREGGVSLIDLMRTVGSQDRVLYKLEY